MRQLVSFPDKIQICNKIKVLILDHLVFFAREISSPPFVRFYYAINTQNIEQFRPDDFGYLIIDEAVILGLN